MAFSRLASGLLLLCPLLACAQRMQIPAGASNAACYSAEGVEVRTNKVWITKDPQSTGGTIILYVNLGQWPDHYSFYQVSYETSAATPEGPFVFKELNYIYYSPNDTIHQTIEQYPVKAGGNISRTKTGGYSGSFAGSYDSEAHNLTKAYRVYGIFSEVRTVRTIRE